MLEEQKLGAMIRTKVNQDPSGEDKIRFVFQVASGGTPGIACKMRGLGETDKDRSEQGAASSGGWKWNQQQESWISRWWKRAGVRTKAGLHEETHPTSNGKVKSLTRRNGI